MPVKPYARALMWFRRDLRSHDNAALYHALKSAAQVFPVFVLDKNILQHLPRHDRRVEFILQSLEGLAQDLQQMAVRAGHPSLPNDALRFLTVCHDHAVPAILRLARSYQVDAVFCNHDDEPDALARDQDTRTQLKSLGVAWHSHKDHVIFERDEVLTQNHRPYTVFTPYSKAWRKTLNDFHLRPYPCEVYAQGLVGVERPAAVAAGGCDNTVPALSEIGFEPHPLPTAALKGGTASARSWWQDFQTRISRYDQTRDFPGIKGPSYLGTHLRFGTLSPRELIRQAMVQEKDASAQSGASTWINELVWRDFYAQILAHWPHVQQRSFRPEYDAIAWEQGPAAQRSFEAWCQGATGYPLVDAGMRQLLQSGYIHNRLRMVTASFLVKDLGIDWRWGEAFFATHLNDFDLASNNGGWQWAASTGCDAQPWFRIFNPVTQSQKFDPHGQFIRRYVPEIGALSNKDIHTPWLARPIDLAAAHLRLGVDYPEPIVLHDEARLKTLARYGVVKGASKENAP